MGVAAESSAAQRATSAVRTLEASAKRQKVLAGMPILHESDVDVNVDAHKPDDREQWTQRAVDWDKKCCGAKRVESCLTHRRCMRVG